MDNDNYIYELEQALTRLLELFEPGTEGNTKYILYDDDGDPQVLFNSDLDAALDHANEVMYGDEYTDD